MSSRLAVILLHQRTASLDARERLTAVAAAAAPGRDLVRLLTCHRVEIYGVVDASADARSASAARLASHDDVLAEARVLVDGEAAAHLFRVAVGLDSAIVGEGQIVGQVRAAYETARSGGLDPILASLFQRALHLARTVRATTELGSVRRSIGSLAVDEALRDVPDATAATALVVGAGEVGKLAARALASRVGRLIVANRDAARAADLAAPIDADVVPLDRISEGLERADVVISAADTRGTLLTRDVLAARAARRPLVLVDIAVPRSVAEDTRHLPGMTYRDVDHLAAAEASAVPAEAIAAAVERCAAETVSFTSWLRERESADTIRALRERADEIRVRQLERAMRHLGHLSERDREVVASLASGLTHALLHEPTVRMRGRPDAERAARALFGLESDDGGGARS
ncbi:MAG: glutamyl-tRNA reductase [Chloroflexota bacterium]|nr:glutamyl-tRNA reductase [Chloroflexota bacterium]